MRRIIVRRLCGPPFFVQMVFGHIAFSAQGLADFSAGDMRQALAEVHNRHGGWVCVIRGAEPVVSYDGRQWQEHPVPSVHAVDTLGAGDIWHGAFASYLAGCTRSGTANESRAVTWASAAAALSTLRTGGGVSTPNRTELEAFLSGNSRRDTGAS